MMPNFRKSEGEAPKSGFISPPGSAPAPAATRPMGSPLRTAERGVPSIIGPELVITGNLMSRGELQVEGEIQGDIHGSLVMIGERATVTGGIIADEVVVRGHVMGSVRGKRVLLQSSSHVEGDIYHLTLAIEQGAYFEGKSRRTEDPTAGFGQHNPTPAGMSPSPEPLAPPPLAAAPELMAPPPAPPAADDVPPA
jgi:cytoskeletal protein CcmA (bactofilin family)